MSGYMYPWMQPAMGYAESGYVDPIQSMRGAWAPEMRQGAIPPMVPSGGSYPLVPSNTGDVMTQVPTRSTMGAIGHGTMENIMNPGFGNIAAAALPMIQGNFSPESIGSGVGGYLGSAAGGAAAGALSSTAAGAALGSALGPIGTGIGGVIGAIGGGEIGKLFGGKSKEEKEAEKQKKRQQYQWLGDAISRFSGEISNRGLERRNAIDSINQYLAGGNAQRAQMRPY